MRTLYMKTIGRTEPKLAEVDCCQGSKSALPIQRTPSHRDAYGDPGGDIVECTLDDAGVLLKDIHSRLQEVSKLVLQKDGKESTVALSDLFQRLSQIIGSPIAPCRPGERSGWKTHNGYCFLLNSDGLQVAYSCPNLPAIQTEFYFHPSQEGLVRSLMDGSIGLDRIMELQEALAA